MDTGRFDRKLADIRMNLLKRTPKPVKRIYIPQADGNSDGMPP